MVEDSSPTMSYMGGGRGDYIQETTYRYVGRGGGEFGVLQPSSGQSFGTWFFLRFLVLVGSALLLLALIFMWPQPLTTTSQLFDCEAGAANWRLSWSPDKQQWCCEMQGRGCSTGTSGVHVEPVFTAPPMPPSTRPPTPQPSTTPPVTPSTSSSSTASPRAMLATTRVPHDCNADGVDVWSEAKKEWCCLHAKKGCPTLPPPATPPPTEPFDCDAGVANWQLGWSLDKKEWCCKNAGKGCPRPGDYGTSVQTTRAPFDCIAGFADWKAEWSDAKKAWCCKEFSRGCTATAEPQGLRKRK